MSRTLKDQARMLKTHLGRAHNVHLSYGHALEAIASINGHENWNALSAATRGADARPPTRSRPEHALMEVTFPSVAAAGRWIRATFPAFTDSHAWPRVPADPSTPWTGVLLRGALADAPTSNPVHRHDLGSSDDFLNNVLRLAVDVHADPLSAHGLT